MLALQVFSSSCYWQLYWRLQEWYVVYTKFMLDPRLFVPQSHLWSLHGWYLLACCYWTFNSSVKTVYFIVNYLCTLCEWWWRLFNIGAISVAITLLKKLCGQTHVNQCTQVLIGTFSILFLILTSSPAMYWCNWLYCCPQFNWLNKVMEFNSFRCENCKAAWSSSSTVINYLLGYHA